MATRSIISNTKMHTLAQAISAKGGASLPMTVDQMAAAVAAIPTGGGGASQLRYRRIQRHGRLAGEPLTQRADRSGLELDKGRNRGAAGGIS